jgi:cell pole-organizing protein PopZ
MPEANSPEPTMEEILASIRRIISEDDAPADAPVAEPEPDPQPMAAAPEPKPAPIQAPEPAEEPADEDVLELTDRLDDLDLETPAPLGDIELMDNAPQPIARAPDPVFEEEELVSPPIAGAAASAFGHLHRQVLMPGEGRSLEDVTRELLRPLLKAWLDEHLPSIVEAAVEAEVDRISRQRR